MKKLLLALLVLAILPCSAQTAYTFSGKIIDANSKEPISGVNVFIKGTTGVKNATDNEGNFSISLSTGRHIIVCSVLGYNTVEQEVRISKPQYMLIEMNANVHVMEEIVISSRSSIERISNVQIGVQKIDVGEMSKVPVLFGERDIIRSIQLLPGVSSEGEGSGGFQVRGGTSSQNLIMLDKAPIYNSGHLMGLFSTFNDDAITNASLYKGQIPAQFGGATSSVFDIDTKVGDMKKYKFSGGLGLLSAKANIEGPIVKDKASFFVSARRTYFDLFLALSNQFKGTILNFHDINAKVDYNISENDKLFLSFFTSRDNIGLDDDMYMDMKWGNTTSTIRWFHKFSDKFYSNTWLIGSWFWSDNSMNIDEIFDKPFSYDSFIKQATIRQDFTFKPNAKHEILFGFQGTRIDMKTAEWEIYNYTAKEERYALDNSIWINDEWKLSDKLSISAGLRLNDFSALGGSPYYELDEKGDITDTLKFNKNAIVKSHLALEPRFSANYRITDFHSIKTGYSRTSQHISALRNTSMSMPFDRYIMSSNIVQPQVADQASLGYIMLTEDSNYEFSVEGYYKVINNVLDYKDGKSFASEIEVERLVLSGKGRAYGMEVYARKNMGRLTGWISYTLSWVENKIPGINNDRWYVASNDRRHDVAIVGMYEISDRWNASATWVYNTGQALTAPSAKYEVDGVIYNYYTERNGYRSPANHRLDVSMTYVIQRKNYTSEWVLSVYNLYNRYNPFMIRFNSNSVADSEPNQLPDPNKLAKTKTTKTALFGIVPSISYNIKF